MAALLPVGAGRVAVEAAPVDTSSVYSNLTGTITVDITYTEAMPGYSKSWTQHVTFQADMVEDTGMGGDPYWTQDRPTYFQQLSYDERAWSTFDGSLFCHTSTTESSTRTNDHAQVLASVDADISGPGLAFVGVDGGWQEYSWTREGPECTPEPEWLPTLEVVPSRYSLCLGALPAAHPMLNMGTYVETDATVAVALDCQQQYVGSHTAETWRIRADLHGTKRSGRLQPLSPTRVMDTRPGGWTVDGLYAGIGQRTAGSVTELRIAGRAGVPLDASAVVLNVAVTEPDADGFLTLYPCGDARPLAASINYAAGQTISNAVTARLGSGGATCIYAYSPTQVVVDVTAAYPADAGFAALVPARVLETRPGQRTVDGVLEGIGLRPAGSVTEVVVAGRAGVPVNASAVVLNVAVTDPQAGGYLTIYPCGWTRPLAASLNYAAGETISNAVTAKVGDRNSICVYTLSPAHVVIDVTGAHPGGVGFVALSPARLLETRAGEKTVDGVSQGIGLRAAGSITEVVIAGRGNVPLTATTAVLNVAVTGPTGPGYLTVYPCGELVPLAASINFAAGQTISNAVTAKLGTGGKVCVFTYAPTHVVIDVTAAHAT